MTHEERVAEYYKSIGEEPVIIKSGLSFVIPKSNPKDIMPTRNHKAVKRYMKSNPDN